MAEALRLPPAVALAFSMVSLAVSQLLSCVQRTIDATNVPFLAISSVFTLIITTLRFSWYLLCRICRQHWIFLCIFYLHLWQRFKSSPPIRPLAPNWNRIVTTVLFIGCAAPAALILHASIPLFLASWRNSREGRGPRGQSPSLRAVHTRMCARLCRPRRCGQCIILCLQAYATWCLSG